MADSQSTPCRINAIVIGASAGGFTALQAILPVLPSDFAAAVIVVLHVHQHSDSRQTARNFGQFCALPVKEAEEKEPILAGSVYLAPANYHLLVERDFTFSLSIDAKVHYSRPAIDVLFETAAEAYQQALVGVILSGASCDGSAGLHKIKQLGGLAVVQAPQSAQFSLMPQSAVERCALDATLLPAEIGSWLVAAVNAGIHGSRRSSG